MFNFFVVVLAVSCCTVSASENATSTPPIVAQTTNTPAASVTTQPKHVTTESNVLSVTMQHTIPDTKEVASTNEEAVSQVKQDMDSNGETVDTLVFIAEANNSIFVTCPLEGTVSWHKNNEDVAGGEDDKFYTVFSANRTLLVKKVGPDHCCEYLCKNGTHDHTVVIWVTPFVHQQEKKYKNIIEGDPFVMECKAWGYPEVTLNWTRGGHQIVADDRIIFKDNYSKNSTLRVQDTQYDDAAVYECLAVNKYGNASMVLEMFVKDKLAALWPFLGICGEVIILCVIIFIYEKRRNNRLAAQERRDDQLREESERLNAGGEDKTADGLKHRKN